MIEIICMLFHNMKRRRHIEVERMELHEQLRKARTDAGLSVKAVAGHLNLTRVQIWRMEKENADWITTGRLKKLASLYGVPIISLFADNIEFNDTDISYQLIGDAVEAVNRVADGLASTPTPEATKSAVLAVIRLQQERWVDDPKQKFVHSEFKILIESELKRK